MKVTDCGCFGDFLKLEPFTSFKKDVVLMVPAIIFLLKTKDMHSIFNAKTRNIITLASIGLFTLYGLSNFVWDIPGNDFRDQSYWNYPCKPESWLLHRRKKC